MTDARDERGRCGRRNHFTGRRWRVVATVIGLILLVAVPGAPTRVEALGELLPLPGGFDPVSLNCPGAVMKKAPTFSALQGSATYPFEEICAVLGRGGGVINFFFEGRWNPSETRQDRPNAVETLFIEEYARYIPGRQQRSSVGENRIFLYWTARCTADPWLQGGSCQRLAEYIPDDVRAAFPYRFGDHPFPLTGKSMSPSLKQKLAKQYQAANTPISTKSRIEAQTNKKIMAIQPQQSQEMITQSQRVQSTIVQPQALPKPDTLRDQVIAVQPQAVLPKPDTAASSLSRSGIFARGVEGKEDPSTDKQKQDVQPVNAETSDMAVLEEGSPEIVEPVAVTLDRPLHVVTATGDAVVLKPGVYEIGAVMDVQLGLAKVGQPVVLLHAQRGTHHESITRTLALTIQSQSNDEQYLVFLTPDGKRYDASGSTSGIKPRSIDKAGALPDRTVKDAVIAALAKPVGRSSPPCQANPAEIGPRWIPVPCTIATIPAPAPTP